MAESKGAALEALYAGIAKTAASIDENFPAAHNATVLRNLALAYRYAAGGAQPGSVEVEK